MSAPLIEQFTSPPSAYRGKPFWSWNARMEEGELRRQIRLMHRMGLGGFFMHARVGLATPYLSDQWFQCVGACVDEAGKLGMEAWLYDEDRWPSGPAGGFVTENPAHRRKQLVCIERPSARGFKWDADTLAVFTARIDGQVARDVKRIGKRTRPSTAGGRKLLVFKVHTDSGPEGYEQHCYIDTMSRDAVAAFIGITHEAYRERFGEHFGKLIPGTFTDEPNYSWIAARRPEQPAADAVIETAAPWTPELPDRFAGRTGRDLLEALPELFYLVGNRGVSATRWHYYECCTALFVEAFSKQIGEWCGENNLLSTGHMLAEDDLIQQTETIGCAMRHYEYMQAPGMDQLTEPHRQYDTAKQVGSVARQFGRRWRLNELYGCTGWDFPFAGHKALGDWQAALGINIRCQHLAWYSMAGQAKRDYPASTFYQSPWWDAYPAVEDYFARVHTVLAHGQEVRDLLVLQPIESVWALTPRGGRPAGVDAAGQPLPGPGDIQHAVGELRDELLSHQVDFDYGDEGILARHGRVGRSDGQPALRVNQAAYKAVIVPSAVTLRASTVALLEEFRQAGGEVVFCGRVADHVDAEPSPAVGELADACRQVQSAASARKAVEPACRRLEVTHAGKTAPGVLYQLRQDRDNLYLFVCNTGFSRKDMKAPATPFLKGRKESYPDVRIAGFADCAGQPQQWDPQTGQRTAAVAERDEQGRWVIATDLPRFASRIFVVPKKASRKKLPPAPQLRDVRRSKLDPKAWPIRLSEPNVVVLDRPAWRLGASGRFKTGTEIIALDMAVREQMDLLPRAGKMIQPWARKPQPKGHHQSLSLQYAFDIQQPPPGPLHLGLEFPELYEIRVNGRPLCSDMDDGWWVDRSLRTLAIDPAMLVRGTNRVELTTDYHQDHPGLEIVYLLGRFGTKVRDTEVTLTAAPEQLKLGNWTRQGLSFYSGTVSYLSTIRPKLASDERLFLRVGGYEGVAVRAWLNGQCCGVAGWEPNEIELTEHLADAARCELAIEVLGHRRNSHGPLHVALDKLRWTGPSRLTPGVQPRTEGYHLVPCGLTAPPELIVRQPS